MSQVEEKLFCLLASVLKVPLESVHPGLGMGDIAAWDSLGHLRVMLGVQESFGVSFGDDEMLEVETVTDLLELLRVKL